MKYRGKTTNKNHHGSEVDLYNFTIGKPELVLLLDILTDVYKKTPRSLFTQPFTSRVDAMKKELVKISKLENVKWPISRVNYQSEGVGPEEIF